MTGTFINRALNALAGLALFAGIVSGAPSSPSAQPLCAQHGDVVKQLSSSHAETPIAIGLAANGGVIEIFSTGDGSTWTMVITMPDGMTCMMAAGESWETLPVNALALGPQA